MKTILTLLSPAVVITLIYVLKKYLLEEDIRFKDLLKYYLISTIIMDIIMVLLVKIKYDVWTWDYNITLSFFIKYFLLGSIISLFLPSFYYDLRDLKKKTIELNRNYSIFSYTNFKKMISDNKRNVYKFLFFITGFLFFYSIDFVLRNMASSISSFSSVFSLAPNVITLTYIFIFTVSLYYMPKTLSKIIAIFLYLFNFALFIANYFLLVIKSEALSIYTLNNTKEGFTFINFLVDKINIKLVVGCLLLIFLMIINFVLLTKIKSEKTNLTKKKTFKIVVICAIGFMLGNIALIDYDSKEWKCVTYERYYYNNFVNSNKSLASLGLYEYTLRDIHLYIKEMNKAIGSKEEIEKLMNTYHTDYEENEYTGIFKNKNLIMIMMESIDYVSVTEEAMPTLYNMMQKGWNFKNRYSALATGGSTIATEFASMSGLIYREKFYKNVYNNYYPYSLPNMFNGINYKTMFVHENNGVYYNREGLHKHLGFNNSYFLYDILQNPKRYVDAQIIENDDIYNKIVLKDDNFMSFIVTIAAHGPYDSTNGYCRENDKTETEKECLNYLAKRTDDMLKLLLERLESDGLLDDTVIVLYTDHQAYSYNYTEEDLANFKIIDEERKIKSIPFVIYNSKLEHKEFDTLVNDTDILPTILNLFGIKYEPDHYIGIDLFSKNHKKLIIFNDFRWYDGTIYSEDKKVDKTTEYYQDTSKYVIDKIDLSNMILTNNYYKDEQKIK